MASVWQAVLDFVYGLFGYVRVTGTSTLTTAGGSPVAGALVTLYYEKKNQGPYAADGSSSTSQTGVAVNGAYLKHGIYDFQARFPGDNTHEPSSATLTGIQV